VSGLPKTIPPYVFAGEEKFKTKKCKPAPEWLPVAFPFFRRSRDQDETLEIVKNLFATSDANESEILKRKSLFLRLFSLLLKGDANADGTERVGKSMRTVLRVKGYLDHHFTENIIIDHLADEFQITTSHLCRIFRENLGVTPIKYIQKLRFREAEKLISETTLSIAEIAYKLGFNDPNYFARIFRNHYGFAPSKHPLRDHI
jgi:AraC-like DNA-binding protein